MHRDGCRTARTRMPASAPSPSPVRIRRPASLRTRAVAEVRDVLAPIGDTCPECPPDCGRLRAARNRADSTVEQSENRRTAYRAYTVGSDGHFVGFEPLTWQLHRDHPPPARPPSSATATPRPRCT